MLAKLLNDLKKENLKKTHATANKGNPLNNPNQKNKFPAAGYFLKIGKLPNQIIGICAICIKNKYNLIFWVTTAMTNSCTKAESKKVTNAAWNFENL